MIVYKCIISGDEMFTNADCFEEKDGMYVVKGKFVTRKSDDVDDSVLGANPSAEEAAEGCESGTESGVNIVLDNRLKETGFGSKKDYQLYMKDYVKDVLVHLQSQKMSDDEISTSKAELTSAFKSVCGKFSEWQFFTGCSMDAHGLIALMEWKTTDDNGTESSVPYLYFYKAGIKAEKY